MMKIDILTLFPEHMNAMLHESILGRAAKKEIIEINCVQIRDFTENKQKQVDDYPYGGGRGCVMAAQPLKSCVDSVRTPGCHVIFLSPQGTVFTQAKARELAEQHDHLVLVCGHYEGVDERFVEECVDEEISLGDFVLTGGEIAAMAVCDAVCRLVPGVLSDAECYTEESHWAGLLEYPQYTRPETWEGREVPAVLRSGNDAEIARWRRKQMIARTMDRRPELFEKLDLSDSDAKLLAEIRKDRSRMVLTEPVSYRPAAEVDLDDIMLTIRQARNYLKKHRVDQWQDNYPNEKAIRIDMERGEAYVMTYGGRVAGYFCLSCRAEPQYAELTDGKWRSGEDYCVLHRNAVMAEFRGTGMADRLMAAVEELTRSLGAGAVRLDTHRHNEAMKALVKRCGYTYRGNLLVRVGEGHDPRRQAFEKLL